MLDYRYEYESQGSKPIHIKHNICSIFLLAIFIWIVVIIVTLLLSPTTILRYYISSPIDQDVYKYNELHSINFTTNRKSYIPLPYFDKEYRLNDIKNYIFLNDYQAIIEPYADMEICINDEISDLHTQYNYTICMKEPFNYDCQRGNVLIDNNNTFRSTVFNFPCNPYETFTIVINKIQDENIIASTNGKGICLYVRREIRDLTIFDLNKYLDASYVLNQLSEEEGHLLYGDNFHTHSYLLKFHYFNAAWQDADHFHEGNGFLTQHCKITNIFEKAIQSVDPSITVPYWDFTIDSSLNGTILMNFLIGDDKYGNTQNPTNSIAFTYENDSVLDARIIGGRWNNLEAEMNTNYPDLYSGYGYLRSPWNLNPSPYVSRYTMLRGRPTTNSFPVCKNHYELLQMNNMMDFFFDMQLLPHGAVHIELGGAFGCDLLKPLLDAGYINSVDDLYGVCRKWFIIVKEGYRANYFYPMKNCTVNIVNPTLSECPFICTEFGRENYFTLFRKVMLNNANVDKEGASDVWYDFLCKSGSRIFTGDHLESASPSDPTFWVIHPTLERLLHAKFMTGGFDDETWSNNPKQSYVCNKAKCYKDTTGMKDFYSDCCYGHYEYDQMFDGISGDRNNKVGQTNREIIDNTDPRKITYSMSYIYDSFTWKHCNEDFETLLNDLSQSYKYNPLMKSINRITTHQQMIKEEKMKTMKYNFEMV